MPMDVRPQIPAPASKLAASKKGRPGCVIFFAMLCIVLLGAAGFIVIGPYRTLNGLQTAVTRGDSDAISKYVDFASLRQNLKDQLNARANAQVNSVFHNGIVSQIAGGLATSVVDGTVDALVTPVGLNRLLAGAALAVGQYSDNSPTSLQQRFQSGRGSFESLSTFTLAIPATAGSEIVLVLTRNGLTWQLTNVRLAEMNNAPSALPSG